MSQNYDNWEKLVGAVMKRAQLRQIALSHSRDSSCISDQSSSSFSFKSSSRFDHQSLEPDYDAADDGSIGERSVPGVVFLPVEARELIIWTEDFPERQLPYSFRCVDSRDTEAVEVNSVLSLDIRGKIKTRLLSSKTIYGAYLVFMLNGVGFEAKAMIRFVNDETDIDAERRAGIVHLGSGMVEVQIGSFYVDEGDDQEVEARLMETSCWKTGLFVEGIEFRPLVNCTS